MTSGELIAAPIFKNQPLTLDGYHALYRHSVANPEAFWAEQAEALEWHDRWHTTLSYDYARGQVRWFDGGTLNVSVNCLDRHLPEHHDKTALIWEGNEPGEVRRFSFAELHEQVCRMTSALHDLGVRKGDRVAIYMPMIPELAISMLACARVGAVHSVVFAGFSAESLKGRILDSQCKVVVTSNVGLRGAKTIPLKAIVDEAVRDCACVEKVIVKRRTNDDCPMTPGRDLWFEELLARGAVDFTAEVMNAEDPLFILYTSGSTGKPKGLLHTQAGYLLHTSLTHRYIFNVNEDDIHFCAADCGWVTGHSYVVYGPLANCCTTIMFESIPTYPDAGRYWDVIDRHKATIFYTAPTAIRAIAKEGDHLVDRYKLDSLRVLGSVGEPINRDAWLWYFNRIGKKRCPVVDTWWQTETGGILIAPIAGVTPLKPGSASLPFFGVQPAIVDEAGAELSGNGVKGRLCITFPWPGQARTIYGNHDRFVEGYFAPYSGKYFTGDAARRDEDGYYWITGRVDDVLNVAGHRLGTAEIESAIVQSGVVAEAAVVGYPHDVKGTGIYAFCILKEEVAASDEAEKAIREAVRRVISAIAAPDMVQFVPGLPKTRSGKIMRRILRKMAEGERKEFGDTTSLADPGVVQEILKGLRITEATEPQGSGACLLG